MNHDRLMSQLAAGAAVAPARAPDCPDEHVVAGYVDGGLHLTACREFERHLADCPHCLALVGLLGRERDAAALEPVPDLVVARARALVTEREPRRSKFAPRWKFVPQWAAAAALVLAVPLLLQLGRNQDSGFEGQGRPEPAATRALAPADGGPQVLTPGAGAALDAGGLTFRWTEVPDTPYYDVRIVTDAGDVVIEERVTGTSWQPRVQLDLRPGAAYYVHVDAYPGGEVAVSSDHVPFTVAE